MLKALLMINSVILILLVLVQQGETGGISGAFSGNGDLRLFKNSKERGIEKILSRSTLIFLISFFVLVAISTAQSR